MAFKDVYVMTHLITSLTSSSMVLSLIMLQLQQPPFLFLTNANVLASGPLHLLFPQEYPLLKYVHGMYLHPLQIFTQMSTSH